jgi:2-polyprenyl-3-methyl-5-hydroxy-6-metoxy-1,4-benzoquinol methylase
MNFKLLFPTYRAREQYIRATLSSLASARAPGRAGEPAFARALDVGCGEGELHACLAAHARELDACDVNAGDLARAAALNADLGNVRYTQVTGPQLPYPDAAFDLVTCLEVIEHVDDPLGLVAELARVTRPGGALILTCPNHDFPRTYDPINHARRRTRSPLAIGAYGYGHSWLVRREQAAHWLDRAGFRVTGITPLSGALAAASELYVPGLLQRLLKTNAKNSGGSDTGSGRGLHVRDRRPPRGLVTLTDALNALDARWLSADAASVGLAFLAERR